MPKQRVQLKNFFDILDAVSVHEIRSLVSKSRRLDGRHLTLEQVSTRVKRLVTGYPFHSDLMFGDAFYRARRTLLSENALDHADELWAPPPAIVRQPGRMNDVGQSRYYCATQAHTAIWEVKAGQGDRVTLLRLNPRGAKLCRFNAMFLGLERSLSEQNERAILEHKARAFLRRTQMGEANYAKYRMVDDLLGDLITAQVPDDELFRYKVTIALTDLIFSSGYYEAIAYPSLATERKGINIVMAPETALSKLTPFEAWEFEMGPDSLRLVDQPELVPVRAVRRTESILPDGKFVWLPRGVDVGPDALEGVSYRAGAAVAQNTRETI